MSKQGVASVIAALISDPAFNEAFFADRAKALNESHFSLTDAEMEALKYIKKSDVVVKAKLDPPIEIIIPVKVVGPKPIIREKIDR